MMSDGPILPEHRDLPVTKTLEPLKPKPIRSATLSEVTWASYGPPEDGKAYGPEISDEEWRKARAVKDGDAIPDRHPTRALVVGNLGTEQKELAKPVKALSDSLGKLHGALNKALEAYSSWLKAGTTDSGMDEYDYSQRLYKAMPTLSKISEIVGRRDDLGDYNRILLRSLNGEEPKAGMKITIDDAPERLTKLHQALSAVASTQPHRDFRDASQMLALFREADHIMQDEVMPMVLDEKFADVVRFTDHRSYLLREMLRREQENGADRSC